VKHAPTIAAVLAVAATMAPAALAHPAAETRRCGQIGFTPNSDDVAGSIRATGLTCGLARDFVRDAGGEPGDRVGGFRCTSTAVDAPAGLPYKRYRCTGAGDVIRWRKY
jgi:hypothetical protein